MKLPPPIKLGLPDRFSSWRPGQARSVMRLVDSPSRFPCLVAPTGSGKTGIIAATIRLLGGKWVWLVSTKPLADQVRSELGAHLGYADVRGQSNYPCPVDPPSTVDLGPCHAGHPCDLRRGGCPYYDAIRTAHDPATRVTLSNYSWWLHANRHGEPFPAIDGLVLDEAHAAPDELASFLACLISRDSVRRFLHGIAPPPKGWRYWAHHRANDLETELEILKSKARTDRAQRKNLRTAKLLLLKLNSLSSAPSEADWVMEESKHGWSFDPVSPAPYSETLFRSTPKVILVSATMRPKTLHLLGLKEPDYDFHETPSSFPVARRPVYHFHGQPRIALSFRSDEGTLRLWVARIDNIIRRRLDRKGIIHCVSYARRDYLLRTSTFRHLFITHQSGEQSQALSTFRAAPPPAIFLSPSATTGIDLPYCLAPQTRVLTADLEWKPIGELSVGAQLAGFDESAVGRYQARRWRLATITAITKRRLPCYQITFQDGRKVIASAKHKWLTSGQQSMRWVETERLRASGKPSSKVVKVFDVWGPQRNYDAGYLAAAFDGEGSMYHGRKASMLAFSQKDNVMLEQVTRLLTKYRFRFGICNNGGCKTVFLTGRANIARFLGTIRPVRLLPKWDWNHIGTLKSMGYGTVPVVDKLFLGVQDVIAVSTTTKTLVAEGFATHNSDAEYGIMAKVPFPDQRSKILRARAKLDKEYPFYLAMLDIVQASGRGMRAADDQHEFFLVDQMWSWFVAKYKKFAPLWFLEACKSIEKIPDPPPPLTPRV